MFNGTSSLPYNRETNSPLFPISLWPVLDNFAFIGNYRKVQFWGNLQQQDCCFKFTDGRGRGEICISAKLLDTVNGATDWLTHKTKARPEPKIYTMKCKQERRVEFDFSASFIEYIKTTCERIVRAIDDGIKHSFDDQSNSQALYFCWRQYFEFLLVLNYQKCSYRFFLSKRSFRDTTKKLCINPR